MPAVPTASYCCLPSHVFSATMFPPFLPFSLDMHSTCYVLDLPLRYANEKQHVVNVLITDTSFNF